METNIIRKTIDDPVGTHQFYFWNSNRKVVQSSVLARFWLYFEPECYGNDRFACSRLVLKSIDTGCCTYELMATITLSEIHNISILPYSKMKTSENMLIIKPIIGQYILSSARYICYEKLSYSAISGFQFSTYIAKKAVYCKIIGEQKSAIDYSTWLSPFRFEVWLAMFMILLVLVMPTFSFDQDHSINIMGRNMLCDSLNLIGVFVRVSVPIDITKRHVYIFASVVGLFHCGIYDNFILSEVVQANDPTQYSDCLKISSF